MATSINPPGWVVMFGGAGREQVVERLSAAGIAIELVVVASASAARLSRATARFRELALPTVVVSRAEVSSVLEKKFGSGMLSIGFPYILPDAILRGFRPALNLHPTLLPRYRGPTSGAYILINREAESGSTVHYMTAQVDRGSVIAQSRVPLTKFDTLRSMQRKVYATEPQLVLDAIAKLRRGEPALPQDEKMASEFPRRRVPEDSQIDASLPLNELVDAIRACDPDNFPAFFFYHGERVCVRLWRPDKPSDQADLL